MPTKPSYHQRAGQPGPGTSQAAVGGEVPRTRQRGGDRKGGAVSERVAGQVEQQRRQRKIAAVSDSDGDEEVPDLADGRPTQQSPGVGLPIGGQIAQCHAGSGKHSEQQRPRHGVGQDCGQTIQGDERADLGHRRQEDGCRSVGALGGIGDPEVCRHCTGFEHQPREHGHEARR
ncbi:MAG: hypothetical protein MK097_21360, partial [Dechloromonas sp.]|nr:hypothetical protein [Dechloromonas sp.]